MRPRSHLAILAALLAAAPLLAQGRRDRGDTGDESRMDTTVALGRSGTVDLSLVSGTIRVTNWDRDQVRITASTERGVLDLDASASRVALNVRSRRGHMGDTEFDVTVPSTARLLLRSTSGEILSRGGAEVEAHSVSGNVDVQHVSGRTTLESMSGDVTATTIGGSTHAKTVSGDLILQGVTGDVDAETVSGDIELTGIHSAFVRVNSTSGDVHYEGNLDPKGRYDIRSFSGDVRLVLPPNTGATMSVETFSGDVDSDFPMTLLPGDQHAIGVHKRLEFKIGNGGAVVSATTFSGNLIIERGSGRQEN